MPILQNSRYENSSYTTIKYKNGKVKKYVHARPPLSRPLGMNSVVITYQNGQMLDEIATMYGMRETEWYILAEVNDIFFGLIIPENTDLKIPV